MKSIARLFLVVAGFTLMLCPQPVTAQSRNAEDYLFLTKTSAKASRRSLISGNMAVNEPGGLLNLSPGTTLADGTQIVADNVQVNSGSRAFDVFGNNVHVGATAVIAGTLTEPIPPPIYSPEPLVIPDPFDPANFPPAFPIDCG